MSLTISKKWLYLVAIVYLALSLVLVSFDIYYQLLFPVAAFLVYLFIVKPSYVLYFLAFATPLSVQWSTPTDSLALSIPTEPLIILVFIGLIFSFFTARKIDASVLKVSLGILLSVDLVWLGVTTVFSTMPLISVKYLMSKIWYLVIFYYFLTNLFRRERSIKIFMWCFVLATVVLAVYTLYNHQQGGFSRTYAYAAMRPFIPDHGMYAACISFSVPILFVFALYGDKLNYGPVLRVIAAGLMAFMIVAVALSFTRASWLSLVLSFGLFVALYLGVKFRHLLILFVAVVGVVIYKFDDINTDLSRNKAESDDNIEEHLQSVSNVTSDPSNMERLNRWSCAYRMFQEKPVFGFGPGTYTFQYGVYQLPHQMTIISTNSGSLGNVHSEYLRPLVESGLIGALMFVLIVLVSINLGFKQFKALEGSAKYLSLAAVLALVTYFAHGVMNNYSEFDKIAVPMYAMLAVLTAFELKLKKTQDAPKTD